MNSIIESDLLVDIVLKFTSFKQKLRLRCVNRSLQHRITLFCRRSVGRIGLGPFLNRLGLESHFGPNQLNASQLKTLISLSKPKPELLALDLRPNDRIRSALIERLYAAKEVHFFHASLKNWLPSLDFTRFQCSSVVVAFTGPEYSGECLIQLLKNLRSCSKLERLSFKEAPPLKILEMISTSAPELGLKVVELDTRPFFTSEEEFDQVMSAFPKINALSLAFVNQPEDVDLRDILPKHRSLNIERLTVSSGGSSLSIISDDTLTLIMSTWPSIRYVDIPWVPCVSYVFPQVAQFNFNTLSCAFSYPISSLRLGSSISSEIFDTYRTWDIFVILKQLPLLESLSLEATPQAPPDFPHSEFLPFDHLRPEDMAFEDSFKYPLHTFIAPHSFKVSQINWLLFHCPSLESLDINDIIVDEGDTGKSVLQRLEESRSSFKLKRCKFRGLTGFTNREFLRVIPILFPSIQHLFIRFQGRANDALAANETLMCFLDSCPRLKTVKILNELQTPQKMRHLRWTFGSPPKLSVPPGYTFNPHMKSVEIKSLTGRRFTYKRECFDYTWYRRRIMKWPIARLAWGPRSNFDINFNIDSSLPTEFVFEHNCAYVNKQKSLINYETRL